MRRLTHGAALTKCDVFRRANYWASIYR